MAIRRYKLNAATSATTAAADSFNAQRPGRIKQIQFNCNFDSSTDNSWAKVQISKTAVADFGATGGAITQSLGQFFIHNNFVTSGMSAPFANWTVECDDPITVGEVLYLNLTIGGTVALTVDIVVVIAE